MMIFLLFRLILSLPLRPGSAFLLPEVLKGMSLVEGGPMKLTPLLKISLEYMLKIPAKSVYGGIP
jgi:hypothetical protein